MYINQRKTSKTKFIIINLKRISMIYKAKILFNLCINKLIIYNKYIIYINARTIGTETTQNK